MPFKSYEVTKSKKKKNEFQNFIKFRRKYFTYKNEFSRIKKFKFNLS